MTPSPIDCPSNFTSLEVPYTGHATYTFPPLAAVDNVNGPNVTIRCNHVGQSFPIGTTFVNCTATDRANNVGFCSFYATVIDNTPPNVTCPSDVTAYTLSSSANATWSLPIATDNVAVVKTQIYLNLDAKCSGVTFCNVTMLSLAIGTYTLTFIATDDVGLTASCSWQVTVVVPVDTIPPQITSGCNTTIINTTSANLNSLPYNIKNMYVIKVDLGPSQSTVHVTWPAFTYTDNRKVVVTNYLSSPVGYTQGTVFPPGQVNMSFYAVDASGNAAVCQFAVDVLDVTPPQINGCIDNGTLVLSFRTDLGKNYATVGTSCPPSINCLPNLVATDNVQVREQGYSNAYGYFYQNSPFPWSFPMGNWRLLYVAVDTSGNTMTCLYNVNVTDQESPVIHGCNSFSYNTTIGLPTAFVPCPTVYATDNNRVSSFISNPSLSTACNTTLRFGTYTINFTALDPSGNSAFCTVTIYVRDYEKPVITSPLPTKALIFYTDAGLNSSIVTFPNFTVVDNSGVVDTSFSNGMHSGMRLAFGTYSVTFTATDPSHNSVSFTFTVEVLDNQPPEIFGCLSNNSYIYTLVNKTLPGQNVGTAFWPPLYAKDNVQLKSTSYSPIDATPGGLFPIGSQTIVFTATDTSNNINSCTFIVKIVDLEPPVITYCPGPINGTTGLNSNVGSVNWNDVSATDNSGQVTITYSSIPIGYTQGSLFPYGVTEMIATATDPSNNKATCKFNVTILDLQPPRLINCPSNISQVTTGTSIYVTWTPPEATDNVGVRYLNGTLSPGYSK